MKPKVAGLLQTELLLRKSKNEESFGPEDDYVMGFVEGQKNGEYQRRIFADALEGLINIASTRGEMHTLAYARYLKKRLGL